MMAVVKDELYIPPYGYTVEVVLTDNPLQYIEDEINVPPELHSVAHQNNMAIIFDYHTKKHSHDFVLIFDVKHLDGQVINHESFHLTARILRYVGCSLTSESEEAYCYLSDYIFARLVRKTSRMKEKLIELIKKEEEDGNPDRGEKVQPTT